jgi:hypothetical protein
MKKRALKKSKKGARKIKKAKPKAKPKAKAKPKTKRKAKVPKAIGRVTHFYTNIGVAIVKFNKKVSVGGQLHYKGATTDFIETAKSMQYDHKEIKTAPKGKQIGIKVKKRVREGDEVYRLE